MAFFYDAASEFVDLTPVISRAAQVSAVADALKPFGVDLPVEKIGAELLPANLPKFDLASILPNVAGISLTNLFSGVKMPEIPNVKIRHGLDPQTRRAWVQADVDVEIAKTATMFALGPLAVRINQPRFTAQVRMEADIHGVQQRRVRGRLAGDWRLEVGSFELITFSRTPLEFDESGRLEFDIQPRNVKLAPAMDFLNQLLSSLSPGGLTIRIDGTGVVCSLDLPIPDTQLGAFGFSGLRLARHWRYATAAVSALASPPTSGGTTPRSRSPCSSSAAPATPWTWKGPPRNVASWAAVRVVPPDWTTIWTRPGGSWE